MDKVLFEREKDYGVMMSIINEMIRADLLTEDDYIKIQKYFTDKYHPVYQYPSELIEKYKARLHG